MRLSDRFQQFRDGRLNASAHPAAAWIWAIVVLFFPGGAWAWGADAHRMIAEHALERLSPAARMQFDRLLAQELDATLSTVSTWADEVRSPTTAAWHYLNFARDAGCRYDADRFRLQGNCVVGAIERQLQVLASDAPDERRLVALKFVVHLTADLHQPLHAGFADDRGGNSYQLRAWGLGINLHALWDTALIQRWPGGLTALTGAVRVAPAIAIEVEPGRWAEESCALVAKEGLYPEQRMVGDDYLAKWGPTLVRQLAAAGQRLAEVLNTALARQ